MPVDVPYELTLGIGGLNLRDQPITVPPTELIDSLNWELNEQGAPVKRLGYIPYINSDPLPAVPLEMTVYAPSAGTPALVVYTAAGHVDLGEGDGTWTGLVTGLSTTAVPSFVQLNDVLYWSNGIDALYAYNGTSSTQPSGGPTAAYLAVWRNRIFAAGDPANPFRVYWSDIGGTWTNIATNFVDILGPHGEAITGLSPSPVSNTFDGLDGIFVFTPRATHRIIDDSDNIDGVISGGSNVLVDPSTGTVSNRSVAYVNGRTWCVARNGIYSTDGKNPLHLESAKLGKFFQNQLNSTQDKNLVAISYHNTYRLACTKAGDTANSLVLDAYTMLPRDRTSDQDYPIMAQSIPVQSWVVYPSSIGDQVIFTDASSGDTLRVRQLGVGGADTDGASTNVDITADATTGSSLFGTTSPKRVRRIIVEGRGTLTVGVSADLEGGVGESHVFDLAINSPKWGAPLKWGGFKYGASGSSATTTQWYSRRGRFFNFRLIEKSQAVAATRATLGAPIASAGGGALYALLCWITPLDST